MFASKRQRAISKEVNKLKFINLIREVQFPTRVSNVVLVKKANGKWQMLVDFTNLNQACLKDSISLPKIK